MTMTHKLLVAIAALSIALSSSAADNGPLPPTDVFHYVVFDAGDALEIDWAVEDGAYLYRDEFKFSTVMLG